MELKITTMYKVQEWDSDCECWSDSEDIQPEERREDAEDSMRAAKRRCAYPVRMRVVEARRGLAAGH